MGGYGWHNPWPFEFGGGLSTTEEIYLALRNAVGEGGSAEDDDNTVEGVWRQQRAVALASLKTMGERAVLQAFPGKATDALSYYEQLLGIVPAEDATDVERRAAAAAKFTERVSAIAADVEAELQDIDSRFSLLTPSRDEADTTLHGRAFEDFAGTIPWSTTGRVGTAVPNYSSDFVVYVLFDLGGGGAQPTLDEQITIVNARTRLDDILPAWVGIVIITETSFILDQTPLDGGAP